MKKVTFPVLEGLLTTHIKHYLIRIKPDDIWLLLIVQAISNHIDFGSEELRGMFISF